MKNAIKSLVRMKFMAFLIVFQLAISFMLLNSSSELLEINKTKLSGFEKLMNYEKSYLLRISDEKFMKGKQVNKENIDYFRMDQQGFYLKNSLLEELKKYEDKGKIDKVYINFPFPSMVKPEYLNNNVSEDNMAGMLVNYEFIKDYKLSIVKGRNFEKEDFDVDYRKDPIPIIIGQDFDEKMEIGDIVEFSTPMSDYLISDGKDVSKEKWVNKDGAMSYRDITVKFKVIGFYDNNAIPIMFTKNSFIEKVKFSNSYTIVPCIKDLTLFNEGTVIKDFGVYIEVNSKEDLDYVKHEIEPKLKEQNLSIINEVNFKDEYDKFYETMARDVLKSTLLGGVLMFLSIIGITCVLLGELNDRKKEFGIRIACGATTKILCKEMFIEIVIMIGISSIVSLLYRAMTKTLSLNIALSNIAIMGLVVMIISIVPILRIRKMNPIDLVRGE
ncbi:MAG: ABC transporter permease [Clostridium sp.]